MKAGIYIHVPFCAKKCPYCDFYSVAYRMETAERYTEAVLRNIAALPENLETDSLYFGGGTPSILPPMQIERIIRAVYARCEMAADTEITLEANPLTMTENRLMQWHRAGINRLSVGIQSFQQNILRQLGRQHTPEQAVQAVLLAQKADFRNISIDLMVGLAEQTAQSVADDLHTALSLPITHISSYMLKIEEGTPFAHTPPALLSEDDLAARYLQMHDTLTAAGFLHYEISNFAKTDFESRHNCKYWRCIPYYGIGPAAHSQNHGIRYAVPDDLQTFLDAETQPAEITDTVSPTESERMMLGLRLSEGIELTEFPEYEKEIMQKAKPLIPKYLTNKGSRLAMTPEGWLLQNAILIRILPEGVL